MPNWLNKNLTRLIDDIGRDLLQGRPRPYAIRMSKEAYRAFSELLHKQGVPFAGSLTFMGIPIIYNAHLPSGTFVVDRPATPFFLQK